MFVRREKFDALERDCQLEMQQARERYWELKNRLELVLAHLKLVEVNVPSKRVLQQAKGGPGRSDA